MDELVSHIVITYNQREYVRAALESALAQDYSPLEILVADDCSQDGTWEILQEIQAGYQGPHRLVLHRNPENLGIIRNLEQAFRMATGALIVKADGDDISLPNRVSRLAQVWRGSGRQALMLAHGTTVIDANGQVLGHRGWRYRQGNPLPDEKIAWGRPRHYQGNSCAYHRSLFADFPPLRFPGAVDDLLLTLRTLALGGGAAIWHLPDELTQYRMGCGQTTDYTARRRTVGRTYAMIADAFRQFLEDLETTLKGRMDESRRADYIRWTRQAARYYCGAAGLYNAPTFRERLACLARTGRRGILSLRLPLFLKMLATRPAGD